MRNTKYFLPAALLTVVAGFLPAHAQLSQEEIARIREAAPVSAGARPRQPRLLLVFNRAEGYKHSSISRAAKAVEILGQKTGAFQTVQSEDLSVFAPENIRRFDAVVLNNTTQLAFDEPGIRRSLLAFVAGGKGIAGIHAATDNFPTWPEGQELLGGVFDGHPWTADGTWAVRIADPDHPLNAAFGGRDFLINDEIYRIRQVNLRKNCRVLLALDMKSERNLNAAGVRPADRDIPISWVRTYGKGRLFYCSLGHNDDVYSNSAVLKHYLDGIQFALGDLDAPTDPVPFDPMGHFDANRLDRVLQKIAVYRHGDSRYALAALDEYMRALGDSPEVCLALERRFCEFLAGDATFAGKRFVCEKLALVGGDESVPLLAHMLADSSSAGMALLGLEPIPGNAADEALWRALARANGATKIGIITALGNRRVGAATVDLEMLAADQDRGVSAAAVSALGRVGTVAALEALERLQKAAKGRKDILDAQLACADRLRIEGDRHRALAVYRDLHTEGRPLPVRSAALRGLVRTEPAGAAELVSAALRSSDAKYRATAAGLVSEISDIESVRKVARGLQGLTHDAQVQLLGALSHAKDPEIQEIVLTAATSARSDVRLAALRTAGATGDAAAVSRFVRRAAETRGPEQKEARTALFRLHGPGVDDSLLVMFPRAGNRTRIELVRVVAERGVTASVPLLLKAADEGPAAVSVESARALRTLGGPGHIPAMISLLERTGEDETKRELESAIAAAARRSTDGVPPVAAIHTAFRRTTDGHLKASLLNVCGRIGAPASLPVLREAVKSGEPVIRLAAIRALASWPTPEPFADLREVAAGVQGALERTLALRGAVRLLGIDTARTSGEIIGLYREAMNIAPDVAERKVLLSAVGESRSLAGLAMAAVHLENNELRPEAEAAILNIAEAVGDTARREVVEHLKKVNQSSVNRENAERSRRILRRIELYDDHNTSWEYAGPYRGEGERLLHVPFGPELPGAETVQWFPFPAGSDPEKPWLLELSRKFAGQDNVVYLRVNLWSPAERRGRLEVGTDCGVKVWLNGTLVHTLNVIRPVSPGEDHVPVTLRKGWNPIVMKLEQGDGTWSVCLRARDSAGGALEGIRYSTTQD